MLKAPILIDLSVGAAVVGVEVASVTEVDRVGGGDVVSGT